MLRFLLPLVSLVAFLFLTSSSLVKEGGGLDPLGQNSNPPPPAVTDEGGGLDPLG